jgi:Domain of unknown function (DUF5671)
MNAHSTPKDVFFHLLATITLYMSVYAVIALLFACINVAYPDALSYYYTGELDMIRFSVAMLVVAFPVYMLMTWLINRDIAAQPDKAELGARKWLTYLTVFLSALMIIIDVITLVYNFLNGELSVRFYLKVLVVLIVGAAVFGYYLVDLKRSGAFERKRTRGIAIAAVIGMIASIVVSFVVGGSPWYQRQVRFDEQRVYDLQNIQSQVINHWSQKGELPKTQDELTDSISGFKAPTDPETGKAYEYSVKNDLSFTLCAEFKTATPEASVAPVYGREENWMHKAERTCFDRTIDPELYGNDGTKPLPMVR